jgi:hypothetical protein
MAISSKLKFVFLGKLTQGLMLSGEFWAGEILNFVVDFEKKAKKTNVRLVTPLEPGTLEARNQALVTIKKFRTKV